MDDQLLWNLGIARLKDLLADMPMTTGQKLAELLNRYRMIKQSYAAIVAAVDADSVCRKCEGQCCLNGKYRINVLDALAIIAAAMPTSADFFQKPLCPYGTVAGCTMEPGFRPADCILFICDAIEQKLSAQARGVLAEYEQDLRDCIQSAASLTGLQLATPLLFWAAKT